MELERTKMEATIQAGTAGDFGMGRESFPPTNDPFGDLMGGGDFLLLVS